MASFFFNGREIKAVAFDMDGTLVDCEPSNRGVVQNALGSSAIKIVWGKNTIGIKEVDILAGLKKEHGEDKVRIAADDFLAACKRGYNKEIPTLQPRRGMIEILNTFKELGVPIIVVTNSDTEMAIKKLTQCGMIDYMYDIIGSDTLQELGLKSKPESDGYILAAKRLGVSEEELMGWEDSEGGFKALKKTKALDVHIGDHGTEIESSATIKVDGTGINDSSAYSLLELDNKIRRENYKLLLDIKEEKAPARTPVPATPELV